MYPSHNNHVFRSDRRFGSDFLAVNIGTVGTVQVCDVKLTLFPLQDGVFSGHAEVVDVNFIVLTAPHSREILLQLKIKSTLRRFYHN